MCPNGATCLSADCCFSELGQKYTIKRVGLAIAHMSLNTNHSLTHCNSELFKIYIYERVFIIVIFMCARANFEFNRVKKVIKDGFFTWVKFNKVKIFAGFLEM